MVKIAITKGRIEKQVCELLKKANYDIEPIINKKRELKIKTKDGIEMIFAKANDVITFVEHRIVDIGIVGSDTLMENEYKDYYEMLDLEIGKCTFAICSYPEYKNKKFNRRKIIATKYPNIAKTYFKNKKQDVEIIKLEGSVELGAVVGLTDAIIDIVETGSTIRANGLEIIENICDVSTKLIVNKVSLKYKKEEILKLIDSLERSKIDN